MDRGMQRTSTVERFAAEDMAADEARAAFRREGIRVLRPDERIAPLLDSDEHLHAIRHTALLERREPSPRTQLTPGLAGKLYVTSRRVVLVGRRVISVPLDEIDDGVVSGHRLLLVLRDGRGIALQVTQPRLLWVQIVSARASARSSQATGPVGVPPAAR